MAEFDFNALSDFIHGLTWSELPEDVHRAAQRSLIDLFAALAAGSTTALARTARRVAAAEFRGSQASIAFSALRSTPAGAALANGMSLDAMDSHDGHRLAKGHAGAGVLPSALAHAEVDRWSGKSMLTALVVGYEIALRAAIGLHETTHDYHSSGAWVSLGSAAVGARAAGLTPAATRHALGIAEYHGPRSPMMRCIDHPSMLKDGAGWGSFAGVLAVSLAEAGFTGAPADLIERDDVAHLWVDLGDRWRMREIYLKPYACCRWAQPSIRAVLNLQREHGLAPKQIHTIGVRTFREAARLSVARPRNTEEAQYSLAYAVAAALLAGRLGPDEVREPFIHDDAVLELADRVTLEVDPVLDSKFPAQALARVSLDLSNGERVVSPPTAAPGDADAPLSEAALAQKFADYTRPILGPQRSQSILESVKTLDEADDVSQLVSLLAGPP